MTHTERLLSARQAAELLSLSESAIRNMWASGKLPRVKVGRLSRVPESAVWGLVTAPARKDPNQ